MDELLGEGGPGLWWAHMGPSEFDELRYELRSLHPQACVAMLRGWKCQEPAGFFSELGAALQFPYYFEETWEATARMLGDLSWSQAPHHLLMVNSAEHLLAEASFAEVRSLVEVLTTACAQGRVKAVCAYWAPGGGDGLDRLVAAGARLAPLPAAKGLASHVPAE